jgi:uncharacterized coiled-coil DUF342 family protein
MDEGRILAFNLYPSDNMKNVLIASFFLFAGSSIQAQVDKYGEALMSTPAVVYETQQVTYNGQSRPALTYGVVSSPDDYYKDWKKFFDTRYLIEGKKSSGFTSYTNVLIAEWSADTITVHFKTDKDADACRHFIMVDKKGVFISESEDADLYLKIKSTAKTQLKDFYNKQYDEYIADQQKFFDNQIKDKEKLQKQNEKLNGTIQSKTSSIQKTNDNIRETNAKITDGNNEVKLLNSTLEQNRKAVEQAKKELDNQDEQIRIKETEYNKLNVAGALNTKDGEKVMKELEKLRSKREKLQGKVTDVSEDQTSTENNILKAEQNVTKLQSKLDSYKSDIDKHQAEINDAKSGMEKVAGQMKDEDREIDSARAGLEKLKAAKAGVAGI